MKRKTVLFGGFGWTRGNQGGLENACQELVKQAAEENAEEEFKAICQHFLTHQQGQGAQTEAVRAITEEGGGECGDPTK